MSDDEKGLLGGLLVENEQLTSSTPFSELSNQVKPSSSTTVLSELPIIDAVYHLEASISEKHAVGELLGSTLAPNNSQIPRSLTGAALATRLGVTGATISRNKNKQNFEQWTKERDPDCVQWYFDAKKFFTL